MLFSIFARSKVELHIHLDGSLRHETILEVLKEKKMELPGNGSLHDLKRELVVQRPKDLAHFLSAFRHFAPTYM